LVATSLPAVTTDPSRSPRRSRRRVYWIAIGITVVAVGAVLAFSVPVSHSFSATFSCPALYVPVYENLTFPLHSAVSGSWSSSSNHTVLEIRTSLDGPIVYSNRPQAEVGSFSFTANQTTYLFMAGAYAATTVLVTGTYSLPLL
jgi:hypothetical protein